MTRIGATPSSLSLNMKATGKEYWRSLEELSNTPEFRNWLEQEFPNRPTEKLEKGLNRRRFLQLMAASFAMAGLVGCRRPNIPIIPYARPPQNVVPGLPNFYATVIPLKEGCLPILVESHEGRPTKIEGNPQHPFSMGATDTWAQASILELYDPARSQSVIRQGQSSSWEAFDSYARSHFTDLRTNRGRGLCILAEDHRSPAMDMLQEHLNATLPEAKWITYEPIPNDNTRQGSELAFGQVIETEYLLDQASAILSVDHDFLGTEENVVKQIRDFTSRRQVDNEHGMNRLYVVENHLTVTGAAADHRLKLPASQISTYLIHLTRELLSRHEIRQRIPDRLSELERAIDQKTLKSRFPSQWIEAVASDLMEQQSLLLPGRRQPPLVHALCHLLNDLLGNNQAIRYRQPKQNASNLDELVNEIQQGRVNTLVILGCNPVYNAPNDRDFVNKLRRVPHSIHLGIYSDETAQFCKWHLPKTHYLESWGDAKTSDGTYSIVQPLIEPLYEARSALQLIAQLTAYGTTEPYEIVQRSFRRCHSNGNEDDFRRLLHEGFLPESSHPTIELNITPGPLAQSIDSFTESSQPLSATNLEVSFHVDNKVLDGRFANNGWLQELPHPITKLTWDNAAILSPRTANELGITTGDLIRLTLEGRSVEMAAFILPGQADYSVSVHLGYGRTHTGHVGNRVGFNVYPLRTSESPEFESGLTVTNTGRRYSLASTQNHGSLEGRDILREITLQEYDEQESHQENHHRVPLNLAQPPELDGQHQWGMVIDLNQCIGCNACVVACQSENNIPIVGKDEVSRGREMHWIRVDRYFQGPAEDPQTAFQPVACVHCESAPCETVCPVNATVHSPEGLNLQVYNRCVGTRYCSNNCPYKVRRFNWFDYNADGPLGDDGVPETLQMQKNPDVSVRMRGVMEKCTYCIQRIERAKAGARIEAGTEGEYRIPDETVVPACAQACPARAITFGDLNDPESKVSRTKNQPRDYALLGELNTRPRTSYQARVRNPNPRMQDR